MTEIKKTRVMTPRGFLHKANITKNAVGFLAQHREYLTTGELANLTSPLVAKIDSKELLPTPGLEAIQKVVFDHMMAQELQKAEESINKPESEAVLKPHMAYVLNKKGEEVLSKGFNMPQDAERWLDRRLYESTSDCHGVILHTLTLVKKAGSEEKVPQESYTTREESIARILNSKRGPVMKRRPTSGKLGFGMKVKQDHCHFSRG